MRPEISIIVPIYNTENYLDKCVKSILSQSFKNIELILVNDGSTDSSGEKCDKYCNLDERVVVIHQKNKGQGAARNKGLEIARGNFIAFVDSDDFIERDMYEIMYKSIIETDSDIVICQVNSVSEVNIVDKTEYNGPTQGNVETGREALLRYLRRGRWSLWDKLYRRDVLKGVKFLEGRTCEEDHAVMIPILYKLNKVVTLNNYLYNYLVRTGSTTNSCFSIKNFDAAAVWETIFYQAKSTDEEIYNIIREKMIIKYIELINGAIKSLKVEDKIIKKEIDIIREKLRATKKYLLSKKRYMVARSVIIYAFDFYKRIVPSLYNIKYYFRNMLNTGV